MNYRIAIVGSALAVGTALVIGGIVDANLATRNAVATTSWGPVAGGAVSTSPSPASASASSPATTIPPAASSRPKTATSTKAAPATTSRQQKTTVPSVPSAPSLPKVPKSTAPVSTTASGPMVVKVDIAATAQTAQSYIDQCIGPVLDDGVLIAEHDQCGGLRYTSLVLGSKVQLTGTKVRNGLYVVSQIVDTHVGATDYPMPSAYALQTCVGTPHVRMWYLTLA